MNVNCSIDTSLTIGHYPVQITKGDRIAQLVFSFAYRRPELVKDEDRQGGLGSTGTGEPLSGSTDT